MTTEKYLNQAVFLHTRVQCKQEEVQRLRLYAEEVSTGQLDCPRVISTRSPHTTENLMAMVLELEEEITRDSDRLEKLAARNNELISAVQDPVCRLILQLRYVCFQNMNQIAGTMCYTKRHTQRLLRKALSLVKLPADASGESD